MNRHAKKMVNVKFGRYTIRNILFSQWHKLLVKKVQVLPTGVEPMTFRTPIRRSTTELQETRGSFRFRHLGQTSVLKQRFDIVFCWTKVIYLIFLQDVVLKKAITCLAPLSSPAPDILPKRFMNKNKVFNQRNIMINLCHNRNIILPSVAILFHYKELFRYFPNPPSPRWSQKK